ncbi:MAG: SdrD B-like domain-containing protein [Spirosomataceae bacterium]
MAKVILYAADGSGNPLSKLDSTTTAGGGKYLFTNLPAGNYVVRFPTTGLPAGCIISPKQNQAGVSDSLDSDANPTTGFSPLVVLDPEQGGILKDNLTVDAALFSPLGSIGDYVWKDINNNGIQDDGNTGVNGVKVVLFTKNQAGAFVATDTTTTATNAGNMGYYKFEGLSAGEYQVKILTTSLPPACILSTLVDQGGDDTKDSDFNPVTGLSPVITLNPIQGGILKDNPTIDAALYSPLGSIGDFVWKDLNDNGQQDAGEPGVKNVRVILYQETTANNFTPVDTTFTGLSGDYSFTGLALGKYRVKFDPTSLPDTCQLSLNQNVGSDLTDNDADPTTGFSQIVTIDPTKGGVDKDNPTIDAAVTTFDLALRKDLAAGQSAEVTPGSLVKFTITVKNEGSMTATNIVLTDSLPLGMSLSDANWTAVGQIATLNTPIAGPLAPGASVSRDITVLISAGFTGTSLTNFAQIKDAKDKNGNPVKDKDSTPGNGFTKNEDDTDSEPVRIKTCPIPPTPTCAGTIMNDCPNPCVNLMEHILSDIRTEGGKFEWRTGPKPTDPLVTDPTKVCASGRYYLFEVAACGVYSNPALAEVTIKLCPADLSLTKTVSNTTPNQNDNVTYTIKVKNDGPSIATNVEVSDTLRAGLQYVSGDAAFTLSGTVLTGKIAKIEVGQTITLTFVAKVTGTGTIRNFAQVSKSDQPDPDSTPGNGNGTPKEDDEDKVDITVKVPCVIPPTPTCGGMGENTCPDECVNLNSFIHSEIRTEGGYFEWYTTFDHKPGTKVADPTKVCTSGDYYLFEVAKCGEYSNGALLKLKITPCIKLTDLAVEKKVLEAAPYTVGQTITYSIVASNNGPVNATSVTVDDVLPASLTFVSANPAAPIRCSNRRMDSG